VRSIYIFAYVFVPVTDYLCTYRLHTAAALPQPAAPPPTQFSGHSYFHLFATVWRVVTWLPLCSTWGCDFSTLSSQTLLNRDRQCYESWRDAELKVRAVCAVSDTTDEDRWVDLLCCSPHCDTAESCLMNNMLTTFRLSSGCYDRPPPVLRRHQSVPSVSSTTQLLQRICCSALAASYIFLVTFSVLYYVTDSFFPVVPPQTLYWAIITILHLL